MLFGSMGMPKGQALDAEVLKTRRLEARRLLDEGVAQAEVARRLKISRQSVSRWARLKPRELAKVRRQGRKSKFDDAKRSKLRTVLAGPQAACFANELWTVPRVRQVILQRFGQRFSTVHVWRLLRSSGSARSGPKDAPANGTRRKSWRGKRGIGLALKKARRERRTIVFLDESGPSQRPRRASTCARRGQTPILTFNFNWKPLSAIAGMTWRDIYFSFMKGRSKARRSGGTRTFCV